MWNILEKNRINKNNIWLLVPSIKENPIFYQSFLNISFVETHNRKDADDEENFFFTGDDNDGEGVVIHSSTTVHGKNIFENVENSSSKIVTSVNFYHVWLCITLILLRIT